MTQEEIAKLRWRCRRGMLELDEILGTFFDHEFHLLNEVEQGLFIRLLGQEDQDLYAWFLGYREPLEAGLRQIVARVCQVRHSD